jgi:hypothetical protein
MIALGEVARRLALGNPAPCFFALVRCELRLAPHANTACVSKSLQAVSNAAFPSALRPVVRSFAGGREDSPDISGFRPNTIRVGDAPGDAGDIGLNYRK